MNKTIIVIALVIFVSLNFISCSTGGGVEVPTKIVSHESNFNHSITEYYETTDQTILIGKTKNEEEEMVEVWRKIINKGENQQAESEMYYRYGQLISKKEFDYAETAHSSRNGQPLQCIECYDGTNHLSEKIEHFYDNSGLLITKIRYYVADQVEEEMSRMTYEYNDSDLIEKENYYFAYNPEAIRDYDQYTYNEQDLLIEMVNYEDHDYDGTFKPALKYTYSYNDKTLLEQERYYEINSDSEQENLIWICEYTYDDSEKLISKEKQDAEGNIFGKVTYN